MWIFEFFIANKDGEVLTEKIFTDGDKNTKDNKKDGKNDDDNANVEEDDKEKLKKENINNFDM